MSGLRSFRIGFYFDLYSAERTDWDREAEYNLALGPECLDVLLEYPPGNARFPSEDIAYLRSILNGVEVAAHAPTLTLSFVTLNEAIAHATLKEIMASLRVANELGATLLTIHGGEYPYFAALNNRPPTREFIRNVKPLLDEASRLGITVCIENLKNKFIFPQNFEDLDAIFEADSRLQFALDIRHFCVNDIDPKAAFLRYRSRVRSVHYRIDNGLTDEHLREFLETLVTAEYDGCFLIEDAALNVADKSNKPMIDAGLRKISGMLHSLGIAPAWPRRIDAL